jgi:hypothetical protein
VTSQPPAQRATRPVTRTPTPKPKPKPKVVVAAPKKTAPAVVRSTPRDALRVGLPVGVLHAVQPEDGLDGMLLALAGLLLGVAAAGTLVVGVATRRIAGHA